MTVGYDEEPKKDNYEYEEKSYTYTHFIEHEDDRIVVFKEFNEFLYKIESS